MSDRFDLEQDILNCWNVTNDVNLVLENILENDNISKDEITNALLGIKTLYEMKFEKMWRDFEGMIKNESIHRSV